MTKTLIIAALGLIASIAQAQPPTTDFVCTTDTGKKVEMSYYHDAFVNEDSITKLAISDENQNGPGVTIKVTRSGVNVTIPNYKGQALYLTFGGSNSHYRLQSNLQFGSERPMSCKITSPQAPRNDGL